MRPILQIVLIFLLSPAANVWGQSIPTTFTSLEEAYRRAQLEGRIDSSVSFTIRPLVPVSAFRSDSLSNDLRRWATMTGISSASGSRAVGLLPLDWKQQYNSDIPYGWNDGAMIPAKGYQTLVSGGIYARLGLLSIQLKPELIFAENKDYDQYDIYNGLPDLPSRFGGQGYNRATWGQSNIRLNFAGLSLGLSSENLWWGPGRRSSLLMTNNAAGFKHLTFNTSRPLRTFAGLFEFQVLGGRLDGSGYSPVQSDTTYAEWRYLSSYAITYQPKWIPGLSLGMTRSFQTYHQYLDKFSDYVPLFTPFRKAKDSNNVTGEDSKDQLTSVYARWMLPRAKAEIYFEYGLNDHSYNFRDFIMSPEHSRTYIFGMRKMIELNRPDELIEVSGEVTQLSQSIDRTIRDAYMWYTHFQIQPGYTHRGEVLGAGIGPGGNLQSFDISWVKGIKRLGLQFERYVHNDDYYYLWVNDFNGHSRRWVDLGFAATTTWDFNNLLLNAKLQGIQSLNYQWRMKDYSPDSYYIPENDIFNVHAELGLTYRF